jgi:thiol-disulfide isomerase/thioredoxin
VSRLVVLAAAAVLALAGCTANDPLADQYQSGSGQGYISGDGAFTEIPPAERGEPVSAFEGPAASGGTISSDEFEGEVYVVNFWYASCPPCRVEAAHLAEVSEEYEDVPFLGVNTYDAADFATLFETKYGIGYDSVLDAGSASVQLAFASSGQYAPNAVPTTLVVDREGRVAARISGVIEDPSILSGMIDRVLAEG